MEAREHFQATADRRSSDGSPQTVANVARETGKRFNYKLNCTAGRSEFALRSKKGTKKRLPVEFIDHSRMISSGDGLLGQLLPLLDCIIYRNVSAIGVEFNQIDLQSRLDPMKYDTPRPQIQSHTLPLSSLFR